MNNEKEKKINLSFGLMNEIYKIKNYDSWKFNRKWDMMMERRKVFFLKYKGDEINQEKMTFVKNYATSCSDFSNFMVLLLRIGLSFVVIHSLHHFRFVYFFMICKVFLYIS